MHFPAAIAPWTRKKLKAGATLAELRQALTEHMGYTAYAADAVLAAAREGQSYLQRAPLGARPDVKPICSSALRAKTGSVTLCPSLKILRAGFCPCSPSANRRTSSI